MPEDHELRGRPVKERPYRFIAKCKSDRLERAKYNVTVITFVDVDENELEEVCVCEN